MSRISPWLSILAGGMMESPSRGENSEKEKYELRRPGFKF